MTVNVEIPIASSTANGVTTSFPYAFTVLAAADLKVFGTLAGAVTAYVLGVDYTLAGVGSNAGSVNFIVAPAAGTVITRYRDSGLERLTDYQDNGDLLADTLNLDLDRLWLVLQEIFNGGKSSSTALRVPSGETIDALPAAGDRAGRVVGFDSLGAPIAILPTPGDATALALDLASTNLALKGAGQVGYSNALIYPGGSLGAAVKALSVSGDVFTGAGEAGDDTVAFQAFYAALPVGASARIAGKVRVTSTLTLNRRISLICPGEADCFIVDVGTGNDGIVVDQGAASDELGTNTAGGINGITLALNVYGKANACRHAVRLTRLDRSRAYLKVYAGAVQYGLVLDGCLLNQVEYHGSGNYRPPIATPALQVDHVLTQKNVAYNIATNANHIFVTMEGARHGYTQAAQSGEGANLVTGAIEGLTGRAFTVGASKWLHLANLWLEANALASTFDACDGLRIGPGVLNFGATDDFLITNGRGVTLDHYYGGYNIAATCVGTTLDQIGTPDAARNICADVSAVQAPYLNSANGVSGQFGGQGTPGLENLYSNPFFDIWADSGTSAAPRGVTGGSGAIVNRFTVPYPGSPSIYCLRSTASVTGIGNVCSLTLSITPSRVEWFSAMVAVYVPAGQPGVFVHIFNGVTYYEMGRDTVTKDGWLEFRGSCPAIIGQPISVAVSGWNGSAFVAGQVYVGACNIVRGPVAPKVVADHNRRRNSIIGTIANTPDLQGQIAIVGVAPPIAYMAVSNGSPGDWKQIS